MKKYFLLSLITLFSCTNIELNSSVSIPKYKENIPFLMVLGIAQDAGFPQADCQKKCCQSAWLQKSARKMVSCLALVDPMSQKSWMFDATPDFKDQLFLLQHCHQDHLIDLAGIFLTHGHMGHYTGLMHLGREAMGAKKVPVFAMPRMKNYLETSGPWSQLVKLDNIQLQTLEADSVIHLSTNLSVQPILVPHRDEFSETVGFIISNQNKRALFIPDIDKWEKWNQDITVLINHVDYAFLDGTFFENGEIPGRDMRLIPHPFVEESMSILKGLNKEDKAKIHFIHFNHTNPLLQENSKAKQQVLDAGFNISEEGKFYPL